MKYEKAYYWTYWFYKSWPKSLNVTGAQIKKLCLANAFLWRALNIYDDFLDGEGSPANLPQGNNYYRRFLEIYYRLNLNSNFYKLFNKIIADLDKANQEEALFEKLIIAGERLEYPSKTLPFINLRDLSRKSLALCLGPIALLYLNQPRPPKKEIRVVINFFSCALAAKQLSDDACDWLEDLQAGKITAANSLVIRAAHAQQIVLKFNQNNPELNLLFINYASEIISAGISDLCAQARRYASMVGVINNSPITNKILRPMESAVKLANKSRRGASLFHPHPQKML